MKTMTTTKNDDPIEKFGLLSMPPILSDKVLAMLDKKVNYTTRKNIRINLDMIQSALNKAIKEFDKE